MSDRTYLVILAVTLDENEAPPKEWDWPTLLDKHPDDVEFIVASAVEPDYASELQRQGAEREDWGVP